MMNLYKIFFFNFLVTGSIISISAYSWFNMWIGLEINLLSFIPLMKANNNLYPVEASLKYFITQALASLIVLFSIIMILNLLNYTPNNLNFWFMMMMNSALLMKLGAAPFHAWFPEVIEGLNWLNSLILLTWQKLAPMVLIMYNMNMTLFFSFIIIVSSLIGGLMGINQTSLRKIMAYSSINHIAWMLASMFYMTSIWFFYFLIYSAISFNIIMIFLYLNVFKLNQLIMCLGMNKWMNLFFMLNFLSLGGLPPFLGFKPKWLVMMNLVENNFYSLGFILIIATLITLYFYLRITFFVLTFSTLTHFTENKSTGQTLMIFLNSMILMGLILSTSIFNIY